MKSQQFQFKNEENVQYLNQSFHKGRVYTFVVLLPPESICAIISPAIQFGKRKRKRVTQH